MPERRTRILLGAVALGMSGAAVAARRRHASFAPGHPYLAGAPLLMAHRGGAGLAPENTLLAFRRAVEWWEADVLELDVQPTRDGEVVVIHDATVDRTTDGSGRVAELPLEQLRRLDAGYRFSPDGGRSFPFRGRGVGLSTLAEVLAACPWVRVNVEIKNGRAQERVWETIHSLDACGRVLVAASRFASRARFASYPGPVSAAREELYSFLLLHRLHAASLFVPAVHAFQVPETVGGRQVLTPRFLRDAHARNLPVHVWTVNEEADMQRLLDWGADGIITDRPDLLAQLLHRRVGRPLPPGPPEGQEPY